MNLLQYKQTMEDDNITKTIQHINNAHNTSVH